MAIEDLELQIPTRRQLVERHLQFRKIWNPKIDTSEGGEPHTDALVAADTSLPLVAHARRVTQSAFPTTAPPEDVAYWGDVHGVDPSEATGAIGLVRITASVGGGELQAGDALTIRGRSNGPRFVCQVGGRYYDNGVVPVVALDTGVETNLPPGTVLEWFQSPPGIGPRAVVVDQDGEGLTGGRDASSPEEHKEAILGKLRDPPGAENDAHYRAEARRAGVPVVQAFSYPAILGPGTTALALLVFPNRRGGSRAPTGQQLTRVGEHLDSAFGADDSVLMSHVFQIRTTIAFQVDWAKNASGWADPAPWPTYAAAGGKAIAITAVTDALTFSVGTQNGSYSGVTAPSAGKRIALYDIDNSRFVEKRIATVTGSGPWVLTIDTTNNASDEDYTPVVGQRVSPWSSSLGRIADATIDAFEQLGPGEQLTKNQADENRRRRQPPAPARWPYRITQDLLEGAVSPARIGVVSDRALVEGDGAEPLVGLPGQYSYILVLGDLAVFPKTTQ